MVSFGAPQLLWLLAALPLVVLLHFIRARRRKEEVSALFLWARAQELAVRRRRFSPTWLLALQLLFVTALALALAQPSLNLSGAPPRVLVLDASASMAAREPGGTRLAQALEEALALLRDAGEVAVVRAGLGATVAQPLSADHGEVRRALRDIQAVDAGADLARALELARSLAPNAPNVEVHLFSDQAAPVGLGEVSVHPVGGEAPNLGISALELSYRQLFISVVSNLPYPQEVELEVTRGEGNGEGVRTTLLVPARGQANASVPIDEAVGVYRAAINVPEGDALALDNEAFVGSRELRVLLSPPTPALERALNVIPGLSVQTAATLPPNPQADAVVLVGAPEALPAARTLLFPPPQDDPGYERIADWDRSDPLLRFVDLTNVTVAPSGVPLLEGSWRTLAQTSSLTPVLLHLQAPQREALAFRFHPSQTDLVRRPAFPILLANAFARFRTDAQVPLGLPLGDGARATEPGRYDVAGRTYTASLLSAEESRLEVTAQPTEPERSNAQPSEASQRRRDLGLWLVLGGLVLLVAEWLLWSRGRGARSWAG